MRKFFAILPAVIGIGGAIAYAATSDERERRRIRRQYNPHTRNRLLGASAGTDRGPRPARIRGSLPYADTNNPDPYADTGEPEESYLRVPKDEPDYDGGCLLLGKKHSRYGDPYRVCLTHNQEQKLFRGKRGKLKKLGCGVFACAYEAPAKTRVVKFTRDAEDVAALLQGQKTGVVPKVFAVYKLAQGGRTTPKMDPFTFRKEAPRDVPVYAMVIEKLRTIPNSERDLVDEEMGAIIHSILDDDKARRPFSANEFCDNQVDADDNIGCSDVQMGVLNAYEKLKKAGIDWLDMHSGNIGYDRKGKLKVLDLGLTKTQLEHEPETLEGRLAAARQRLAGRVVNLVP